MTKENTKEKKEKEKEQEKESGKDQENDKAKEKDKGKATLGENWPSMMDTRNSPRKKRKSSKPTYQVVLHNDDLDTIVDRVCDNMSESITAFKTVQEALEQTIEAQLMELKTLVRNTP